MQKEIKIFPFKGDNMKFDKDCQVIWHDRRRYLGMPISFTRYYLVKKEGQWVKFFRHKGFFSAVIDETNVYRCKDVSMSQTLGDKIFKTGTLEITSNDVTSPIFHLRNIKNPYKVRDLISSTIELERKKRNVGITEFQA